MRAAALEALGLDEVSRWRRQLSFLNLGSGSGYLSALAAALLGEGCVHVCVELDAALAARSRATLAALGRGPVPALRDVQVVCASAFDVDVDLSMKFDRIYVGAGARHGDARRFGRLLKPDGRLVGPFEDDFEPRPPWGLPQALLRVTRPRAPEGSDEFELDDLLPVQFSNLVRPAGDDDDERVRRLPGGAAPDSSRLRPFLRLRRLRARAQQVSDLPRARDGAAAHLCVVDHVARHLCKVMYY